MTTTVLFWFVANLCLQVDLIKLQRQDWPEFEKKRQLINDWPQLELRSYPISSGFGTQRWFRRASLAYFTSNRGFYAMNVGWYARSVECFVRHWLLFTRRWGKRAAAAFRGSVVARSTPGLYWRERLSGYNKYCSTPTSWKNGDEKWDGYLAVKIQWYAAINSQLPPNSPAFQSKFD